MAKKTQKKEVEKVEEVKKNFPPIIARRFEQVRYNMNDNKVEAAWVTHLPNIRYLTNFSGSAATLLILQDKVHFFTDDRYEEQVKLELFDIPNLEVHITRDPIALCLENDFARGVTKIGIEAEYITYDAGMKLRSVFMSNTPKIKTVPIVSLVEKYTQPKSEEELSYIQKACNIAEAAFEKLINEVIKPGITEIDLAIELEYICRKLGSSGPAFDTIVVTGSRGAIVHGQPSKAKIKKNDILLMDFGCRVNGFCSDITRTVCVGKPTKEQIKNYKLLYNAMSKAISEVRPGMKGDYLDSIARSMIEEAGYGDNFQHSLGHGLGLVCHENPCISFRLKDQIVPDDVVLAIEPGIYLPGKYGMRVEDNVFVTKTKPIKLTNAPEELICL